MAFQGFAPSFVEQAAPRRARHLFTKKLVSFPKENSWVKIARRQFLPHALPIRPHATATQGPTLHCPAKPPLSLPRKAPTVIAMQKPPLSLPCKSPHCHCHTKPPCHCHAKNPHCHCHAKPPLSLPCKALTVIATQRTTVIAVLDTAIFLPTYRVTTNKDTFSAKKAPCKSRGLFYRFNKSGA